MLTVLPEVAEALAAGQPVVALESTIVSHGLPRPDNLRIAREIEQAVRRGGAVPATIAVVEGRPRIGLDDAALTQVATREDVVKVSTRELALLVARGGTGATTVAATSPSWSRGGAPAPPPSPRPRTSQPSPASSSSRRAASGASTATPGPRGTSRRT